MKKLLLATTLLALTAGFAAADVVRLAIGCAEKVATLATRA